MDATIRVRATASDTEGHPVLTKRWWDEDERTWRNGRGRALPRLARVGDDIAVRTTRIVLAAAHLDHDPTNNQPF
jgi:hypothetical protein